MGTSQEPRLPAERPAAAGQAPQELSVLTVNLCMALAGLTNRHLPRLLLCACFPHVAAALCCLSRLGGFPWWACLLALPPVYLAAVWSLGVPLARLMRPVWWLLGFDDFQRERINLFLCMLAERPELAAIDVICVQECYNGLFCPGGYPELLVAGARDLGWRHAAVPPRWPSFPATLAQNSGLLILSRRPIRDWSAHSFSLSLEAANVNRGVLHAELEGGVHIFTCHLSPGPSIAGRSFGILLGPLYRLARNQQIHELSAFIQRKAPSGAAIVAGDFNLSLPFKCFGTEPISSPFALELLWTLESRCGLIEATSQVRGSDKNALSAWEVETSANGANRKPALQFLRPTFGYTGEDGALAERWLTSFGTGRLQYCCDDAILFRHFDGVEVVEEALVIQEGRRPHPAVTHLSDHWAVRARLRLTQRPPTPAASLLAPFPDAGDPRELAKAVSLAKKLQLHSNGCNGHKGSNGCNSCNSNGCVLHP